MDDGNAGRRMAAAVWGASRRKLGFKGVIVLKDPSNVRRTRLLPMSLSSAVPQTLAETIRIGLADEITSGLLRPGAEVDEQAVGERFGASRTDQPPSSGPGKMLVQHRSWRRW